MITQKGEQNYFNCIIQTGRKSGRKTNGNVVILLTRIDYSLPKKKRNEKYFDLTSSIIIENRQNGFNQKELFNTNIVYYVYNVSDKIIEPSDFRFPDRHSKK